MNQPQLLRPGNRIRYKDAPTDGDAWKVVRVTDCAAYVERELKTPRLVEIRDDDGVVVRSFMATKSGDTQHISPRSDVIVLREDAE